MTAEQIREHTYQGWRAWARFTARRWLHEEQRPETEDEAWRARFDALPERTYLEFEQQTLAVLKSAGVSNRRAA